MTAALAVSEQVLEIPLDDIFPSTVPNYRRSFDEAKLAALRRGLPALRRIP